MKAHLSRETGSTDMRFAKRELVSGLIVVGADLQPVVQARFYMGRSNVASTVYCNLWGYGEGASVSGSGSASGYGYHKTSAAMADALRNAGVTLSGDEYGGKGPGDGSGSIAGRGYGSMEHAALALARALTGKRKFRVLSF